jgi:hypothetical protein
MGWDAEPGNAVLLFESGDMAGALSALGRVLEGLTWFHLQRRGVLLAHRARIAALAGCAELATELLEQLESATARWSQPVVRALVAEARAALCGHDDPEAMRLLVLARQLWTSGGVDFHAARVRIDLARRLLDGGDLTGAAAELTAAEQTAARTGSPRLADMADAIRQRLNQPAGRAATVRMALVS